MKIGLIAPFEGLYRESGYAALEAMRQAMVECAPPGLDVLPLALDDGGDPAQAQRAAQKLLVDPTVRAMIGPLLLDAVPTVSAVMTQTRDIPWYIPALVAPTGGFTDPAASDWLNSQLDLIATSTSASRILLLGLPAEWELQPSTVVTVLPIDDLESALATVAAGDALLWLGRPDVGARWLSALRQQEPDVDFWLADQGGIDIFAAHSDDLSGIHWLFWTDLHYNQWSQSDGSSIPPNASMRYYTYRATCDALGSLVDGSTPSTTIWELQSRPIGQPESE